jgi:hypothetical protein
MPPETAFAFAPTAFAFAPTAFAAAAPSVPYNSGLSSVALIVALLAVGLLGWIVAAALGFSRARAFGSPARWFALSALCLVLYHLHLVAFGLLGMVERDTEKLLSFGAFFNVWVIAASVCSIVGFVRLANPRP